MSEPTNDAYETVGVEELKKLYLQALTDLASARAHVAAKDARIAELETKLQREKTATDQLAATCLKMGREIHSLKARIEGADRLYLYYNKTTGQALGTLPLGGTRSGYEYTEVHVIPVEPEARAIIERGVEQHKNALEYLKQVEKKEGE